MRSVVMMALNNIRRKKLLNGLIFFIIFIGAFMFASAINVMDAIDKPFEENHKSLNGFHTMLMVDANLDKEDKVLKWCREQEEVEEVLKTYSCIKNFFIQDLEDCDQSVDKVKVIKGEKRKAPGDNEIWINTKYAKTKNLNVGDKVNFDIGDKNREFKVTAIVIEGEFSSPMNFYSRVFVKKGEIENSNDSGKQKTLIIRYKYKDKEKIKKSGEELLNKAFDKFGGVIKDRYRIGAIERSYSSIFNILGGVLIAISMIIILFVIVVIYFTISEMFLSDFKTIGVLESIGFSKFNILSIYVVQFMVITVIAIPIGIMGSFCGVKMVLKDIFYTYGFLHVNLQEGKTTLITISSIIAIIFIGIVISSLKTLKVNVVEAISKGAASRNNGNNIFTIDRFKNIPMGIKLTLKNIFWRWKESLLLFIIILIGILAVVTALNIRNSYSNIYKNAENFGLEKSHISIKVKNKVDKYKVEVALNKIKMEKDIKNLCDFYMYNGVIIDRTETVSMKINPSVLIYKSDLEELGLKNVRGTHGKNKYEIELGIEMARVYGKDVGDYITLFINGEKKDFLIVGLFNSLIDSDAVLRTSYDLFKEVDPNIESKLSKIHTSIQLNNVAKIKDVISKINKEYGDIFETTEGNLFIKSVMKENSNVILPLTLTITFVFSILGVVCVFNFIVINIYNEKKTLGIYSVLGVASKDLITITFKKITMFYLLAVILVLPIAKTLDEWLMVIIMKGFGIDSFSIIPDWRLNFIFLSAIGVVYIICSLIASKLVLSIDEKVLISE